MRSTFNVIILCFAIMLFGCNPTLVTLKGKYNDGVAQMTTTKPVDSAWTTISGIFTANGLPLKSVDKNKGAIVTKDAPINSIYTFEDKDGRMEQTQAWVVLPRVFNKEKEWKPKYISGKWQIQVAESGNGVTTIKIEPVVTAVYFPNPFLRSEVQGQSTGKLETLIEQALKNQ